MKKRHSKCVVNIKLPEHRCEKFKDLLDPLLHYFDPASICVKLTDNDEVSEQEKSVFANGNYQRSACCYDDMGILDNKVIPRYHDDRGLLSTPSIAIMLFLQERGFYSAQEVQKHFVKFPWRVHHKIELENKRTPGIKIARQEFYMLSREYPLWCVCPVYAGYEHIRINLFVNRYSEMVEFYRLLTDSEMESTKKDFCLFPLSSEANPSVMLCLKRCRQLRPYSLTKAHLSIHVQTFSVLKEVLKCEFKEISPNKYLTKDPDGNEVILEDRCPTSPETKFHDVEKLADDVICDITSVKSVCGSHDSGRYSDSDRCSSILDSKGAKKAVHFSDTSDDVTWFYMTDELSPRDCQHGEREQRMLHDSALRCDELYPLPSDRVVDKCSHHEFSVSRRSQVPFLTVTDCFGIVHNVTKSNEQSSYAYHGQILAELGLDSPKVKSSQRHGSPQSPEKHFTKSTILEKNANNSVLENQTAFARDCYRKDNGRDPKIPSRDQNVLRSDRRTLVDSAQHINGRQVVQKEEIMLSEGYVTEGKTELAVERNMNTNIFNQEWSRTNFSEKNDLNEKEYAERLRVEIMRKRQVEPVYI